MGELVTVPLIVATEAGAVAGAGGAAVSLAGAVDAGLSVTSALGASGLGSAFSAIPWGGIGNVLSGVGALSALAGGRQSAAGYDLLAAQYEEEAANARVAAAQDELQRRRQLKATLSAQTAIRAGRGVELFGGGTGEAIRDRTIAEAEEDILTSRLNFQSRARRFDLAADKASGDATGALLGGVGNAASAASRMTFGRT